MANNESMNYAKEEMWYLNSCATTIWLELRLDSSNLMKILENIKLGDNSEMYIMGEEI